MWKLKNWVLLLLIYSFCFVFHNVHSQSTIDKKDRFIISPSLGYQYENFKWSIAGNSQGQNPNVYSELIWKNIRGQLLQLDVVYKPSKSIFIKTNFGHASVLHGSVTDTDYLGDNRTMPVNPVGHFNSNKGSTNSIDLSIGYKIKLSDKFSISPSAGFGLNKQVLYLLGNDTSSKNLKSTYETNWYGLLVGLGSSINLTKHFYVEPSLFYHQLKYKSEANWNLIPQFKHPVSFRHTANGFELESSLKINYRIKNNLSLFTSIHNEYWKTGKGVDELYLTNGDVTFTQFNGATRTNFSLSIGLNYSFF